ncbi:MAG: metallophosphoesterase family protein [Lachnospiraceae bacterium]|jgi:calcineurin-like phosphoesterase family protein|nr:metallophosphoesterase family protein [Lachnospiraceae bacterium]
MRYYIADLHFYHNAMNTKMDRRGFSSAEEMNEHIITRWNEKVRRGDDIIILGDLSWGDLTVTEELLKRLKGNLYLISGNHDKALKKKERFISYFKWIKPYEEISDNQRKVVLCHYPIICYNGQYRRDANGNPKTYMLYGHVHDTHDQRLVEQFQEITRQTTVINAEGEQQPIPCNMINCFCGYSDYTPLSLDEWIACEAIRTGQGKD